MSYSYNSSVSDGSLRKGWTIKMAASYLRGLIATKITFIDRRIGYWTDELAKVTKPKAEKARRDERDTIADDDDYKPSNRRAAYCKEKLASYQTKLKEARNWSIFFETAGGGDEFAVTLEDALYFGLREYANKQ